MITGIYTIENIHTGKLYVGCAIDIRKRWREHKHALNTTKHGNSCLQKSWNKYGKESFRFELLVECEVEYLYSEEHYWCNLLQVHNRKYGYNIRPTHPNGKATMNAITKTKIYCHLKKCMCHSYCRDSAVYSKIL